MWKPSRKFLRELNKQIREAQKPTPEMWREMKKKGIV